jgi:hypothetical protein
MDERELREKIKKDPEMRSCVWGVFARDELPETLLPGGYIVNSNDRRSAGQHWMGVYVTEDGMKEFMDPLGKKPQDYGIDLKAMYYSAPVQSKDSISCGLYVLYFLYWRGRDIPLHVIMSTLNQKNNDSIVKVHVGLL